MGAKPPYTSERFIKRNLFLNYGITIQCVFLPVNRHFWVLFFRKIIIIRQSYESTRKRVLSCIGHFILSSFSMSHLRVMNIGTLSVICVKESSPYQRAWLPIMLLM